MPNEKHYTADRVEVTDGLAVWDYDLRAGRVSFAASDVDSKWFDGWYAVCAPGQKRGNSFNGERMITRHPSTGQLAEDACKALESVTVTLAIENHYELHGQVDTTAVVTVPAPPAEGTDEYADWAYDHICAETGTGRYDGNASYFVTITESSMPELVGREFEW